MAFTLRQPLTTDFAAGHCLDPRLLASNSLWLCVYINEAQLKFIWLLAIGDNKCMKDK
jgi:hypothetical protein